MKQKTVKQKTVKQKTHDSSSFTYCNKNIGPSHTTKYEVV